MCSVQAHRGPGRRRVAALAHLALGVVESATDPAAADAQPLHLEDESLWIALDGEIYNHADLRAQLTREGVGFRTHAQAEVAARAYRAWGDDSLGRFHGPFALVLHDARSGSTLLIRDQYGMKPLYYRLAGRELFFASEFKPLLVNGECRYNERALLEWCLFGDVLQPQTLFAGILAVAPGHVLEIPSGAQPRARCYYRLSEHVDAALYSHNASRPVGEVLDELDATFQRSIGECLSGEAPIGVMLSGGVDSATITAAAARHKPVRAFHLSVPDDPRMNERPMAERIAAEVGVPLTIVSTSTETYARELPGVIYQNEAPLWHMQSMGFALLVRRASEEGVRILLAGDSLGQSLSADRGRQRALKWLLPVRRALRRAPGRYRKTVFKAMLAAEGLPVTSGWFTSNFPLTLGLIDGGRRTEVLEEALAAYTFIVDEATRWIMAGRLADIIDWRPRIFHRSDRLSMAAATEYRNPLSDVDSIHFAINLPFNLIQRGKVGKWALKEVALRYLPRTFTHQKKVAWDLPASLYLQPFARTDLFADGFCAGAFSLSRATLETMVGSWRSDVHAFYRLLHLELWGRMFMLGESPEALTNRFVLTPER